MNTRKKFSMPEVAKIIEQTEVHAIDGKYAFQVGTFKVKCDATPEAKKALVAKIKKGVFTGTFTSEQKTPSTRNSFNKALFKAMIAEGEIDNAEEYARLNNKPFLENNSFILCDIESAKCEKFPELIVARPVKKGVEKITSWFYVYTPDGVKVIGGPDKKACIKEYKNTLKDERKVKIIHDHLEKLQK